MFVCPLRLTSSPLPPSLCWRTLPNRSLSDCIVAMVTLKHTSIHFVISQPGGWGLLDLVYFFRHHQFPVFFDVATLAVPDEAFRGPDAQLFGGLHLFNKTPCRMVSPYQGRNDGGARGAQFLGRRVTMGAPNHCMAAEWMRGAPKSPKNVTSTFFNTVHLLPKDLSFEHGGAKLASCPRRYLTSSRPCCIILVFIKRKICNI